MFVHRIPKFRAGSSRRPKFHRMIRPGETSTGQIGESCFKMNGKADDHLGLDDVGGEGDRNERTEERNEEREAG